MGTARAAYVQNERYIAVNARGGGGGLPWENGWKAVNIVHRVYVKHIVHFDLGTVKTKAYPCFVHEFTDCVCTVYSQPVPFFRMYTFCEAFCMMKFTKRMTVLQGVCYRLCIRYPRCTIWQRLETVCTAQVYATSSVQDI